METIAEEETMPMKVELTTKGAEFMKVQDSNDDKLDKMAKQIEAMHEVMEVMQEKIDKMTKALKKKKKRKRKKKNIFEDKMTKEGTDKDGVEDITEKVEFMQFEQHKDDVKTEEEEQDNTVYGELMAMLTEHRNFVAELRENKHYDTKKEGEG